MGDKSKIEWTDATWNPIRGCSVVSEGCRNCYAMQVAARFSGEGQAYAGLAYRNSSGAHWTGTVHLVEEHLEDPLRWKRPRRIFVNSMSDLFHESIPGEWIDRIFAVMALAPQHTFQILTKRPERMLDWISRSAFLSNAPLENAWLGVSVEDQKTADERIPLLIYTPAAVRWLSIEPLLGPVELQAPWGGLNAEYPKLGIQWVVVGGESGPHARPMHPDWVRSIRDECVGLRVPFFFKQWGKYYPDSQIDPGEELIPGTAVFDVHGERILPDCCSETYDDTTEEDKPWRFMPVGKKNSGRLLDGREWSEYPNV